MPRIARGLTDGYIFHVLNRGNAKNEVFHKDGDYHAFLAVLEEALSAFDVGLLAYCLMPNHFHLVLRPERGDDLSRMMQWLMTCHVRRYHEHYGTSGHVWQGRYKSFIVQDDTHLLTVLRYVEGNPVRAHLVEKARKWKWSSHRERLNRGEGNVLAELPVPLPENWGAHVEKTLGATEVESLRRSVNRQAPYGRKEWVGSVCEALGLTSTTRKRGRPPKELEE